MNEEHIPRETNEEVQKAPDTLDELFDSDDDSSLTWRSFVNGELLDGNWFRKHIFFIIFILVLTILYVSNRYACQREQLEQTRLTETLTDSRYKALTATSQLNERTRRSKLMEMLSDTSLESPVGQGYLLHVESKNDN